MTHDISRDVGAMLGLRLSSHVTGKGARVSHVAPGSQCSELEPPILVGSVIAKVNGEVMLDKSHEYILNAIGRNDRKVSISMIGAEHLDIVPVDDSVLRSQGALRIDSPFARITTSPAANTSDGTLSVLKRLGTSPKHHSFKRREDGTFGLNLQFIDTSGGARVVSDAGAAGQNAESEGDVVVAVNGKVVINDSKESIVNHIADTFGDELDVVTVTVGEADKIDVDALDIEEELDVGEFDDYVLMAPSTVADMPSRDYLEGDTIGGFPTQYCHDLDRIMELLIKKVTELSPVMWAEMEHPQRLEHLRATVIDLFKPGTSTAPVVADASGGSFVMRATQPDPNERDPANEDGAAAAVLTRDADDDVVGAGGPITSVARSPVVCDPEVLEESIRAAEEYAVNTEVVGVNETQDPENFLDDESDIEHELEPWRIAQLEEKSERKREDLELLVENTSGAAHHKYQRELDHLLAKEQAASILDDLDNEFELLEERLNHASASQDDDLDAEVEVMQDERVSDAVATDNHRLVTLDRSADLSEGFGLNLVANANHRGARVRSIQVSTNHSEIF